MLYMLFIDLIFSIALKLTSMPNLTEVCELLWTQGKLSFAYSLQRLWIVYNIIPCILLHLSQNFVTDVVANYKHGELINISRESRKIKQYRNRREEATLVTTIYRASFCCFRTGESYTRSKKHQFHCIYFLGSLFKIKSSFLEFFNVLK